MKIVCVCVTTVLAHKSCLELRCEPTTNLKFSDEIDVQCEVGLAEVRGISVVSAFGGCGCQSQESREGARTFRPPVGKSSRFCDVDFDAQESLKLLGRDDLVSSLCWPPEPCCDGWDVNHVPILRSSLRVW